MTLTSIVAKASGRVNLIGEHTDYNGGFVLPTAIPQMTQVQLWPRNDCQIRVESVCFPENQSVLEYELGSESRKDCWFDYIQGITQILESEGFSIRGFDARIESQVPMGSGLSSSAALEVSLIKALREAFQLSLNDLQIALIGQKVENEFVGAKVGIMDQMAASLALPSQALFIDTRTLRFKQIQLPLDQMDLLVINSGVIHSNTHGGYNQRRNECDFICESLGIKQLRDINISQLNQKKNYLTPVLLRRARHVVTENDRVLLAVKAIQENDIRTLGHLFYESHQSMRDDYEVSVEEIDFLVELAKKESEVFGARMTGGGFGGSVVMITKLGKSKFIGENICEIYKKETGRVPKILVPTS